MTLDTGHPVIGINGLYGGADEILREWAQKKFNQPIEMVSDPNGSEHILRDPTTIYFAFYWGDDAAGQLFISIKGKRSPDPQMTLLFGDHFALTDGTVITEEEFEEAFC